MAKNKLNLFVGILALLSGISITGVALVYSVRGMMALFAASGLAAAIMTANLEVGKVVASTWLKLNWSNPNLNRLHRLYLLFAIVTLMAITSLGIYGFLSAAHLEQKAPLAGLTIQTTGIQQQIDQKKAEVSNYQKRIDQIDQTIAVFLKNDQASKGLKASASLKKERDDLQSKVMADQTDINNLTTKLAPIQQQSNEVQAKLGPVQYVAQLFGWTDPEAAVRMIILVIMTAFDPLAIILTLSGMMTLREWFEKDEDEAEPEAIPETPVVETPEEKHFVEIESPVQEIIPEPEPEIETNPEPEPGVQEEIDHGLEVDDHLGSETPVEPKSFSNISWQEIERALETTGVISPERDLDRDKIIDFLSRNPELIQEIVNAVIETTEPKEEENESSDEVRKDSTHWLK